MRDRRLAPALRLLSVAQPDETITPIGDLAVFSLGGDHRDARGLATLGLAASVELRAGLAQCREGARDLQHDGFQIALDVAAGVVVDQAGKHAITAALAEDRRDRAGV